MWIASPVSMHSRMWAGAVRMWMSFCLYPTIREKNASSSSAMSARATIASIRCGNHAVLAFLPRFVLVCGGKLADMTSVSAG